MCVSVCILLSLPPFSTFTHVTIILNTLNFWNKRIHSQRHNLFASLQKSSCLTLSYIQPTLMITIRQAIWKSRKCACEADLEPTALLIGGYNKIWILDLELCNTVTYHMWCTNMLVESFFSWNDKLVLSCLIIYLLQRVTRGSWRYSYASLLTMKLQPG